MRDTVTSNEGFTRQRFSVYTIFLRDLFVGNETCSLKSDQKGLFSTIMRPTLRLQAIKPHKRVVADSITYLNNNQTRMGKIGYCESQYQCGLP